LESSFVLIATCRRLWVGIGIALLSGVPTMAFDLQGHRGARGLVPENTLAGFSRAIELGVTTLETDLAVTRDGVLVLSHDTTLNPHIVRGPDGKWLRTRGPAIWTMTLDQLRRYDVGRIDPSSGYALQWRDQTPVDGARIPTLAELFELSKASGKSPRFNIETKISPYRPGETPDAESFARLVVEAVRSAGLADRTTVQSFDWRTLVAVRRMAPEVETSCLTSRSPLMKWLAGLDPAQHGGSLPRLAKAAGCGTWSPNYEDVARKTVEEAHGLGLKVLPWTVNSKSDIARMIDLKVDGLITDFPDRALEVMALKGLKPG
jgi:glycerophosphoryl diester phosphodiesterase